MASDSARACGLRYEECSVCVTKQRLKFIFRYFDDNCDRRFSWNANSGLQGEQDEPKEHISTGPDASPRNHSGGTRYCHFGFHVERAENGEGAEPTPLRDAVRWKQRLWEWWYPSLRILYSGSTKRLNLRYVLVSDPCLPSSKGGQVWFSIWAFLGGAKCARFIGGYWEG